MRKINKPLGWTPKETSSMVSEIVNKEEPAKKKRKTKEIEPEVVVETSVEEASVEPAESVVTETDVEQTPEAPTEPAA